MQPLFIVEFFTHLYNPKHTRLAVTVLHNEKELLRDLGKGDHAAFIRLYNHYSEPLYYATLAMVKDNLLAEEIVQRIFVKIWERRETLDIQQNFSGYLFRTGQRLVYDFFRSLKRNNDLYRRFAETATSEYTHIEEALLRREDATLVTNALATLAPQRRQVFRLVRIEGRPYKEVAEILGISPSTVRDHLVKATKHIRQWLLDHPGLLFCLLAARM